jgi:hypothetical protein
MHSSDNYKKIWFTLTWAGKEPAYVMNLFKVSNIRIVFVATNSLEHNLIMKNPQRVRLDNSSKIEDVMAIMQFWDKRTTNNNPVIDKLAIGSNRFVDTTLKNSTVHV